MSKVGQWVMQMEEDAMFMTYDQFVAVHGSAVAVIWKRIHGEIPDYEPDVMWEEGDITDGDDDGWSPGELNTHLNF